MKTRLLILLLTLGLTACGETSYLYQRTVFRIDCRPDHLQADGQCTPVK